jgi:hypothetical protein
MRDPLLMGAMVPIGIAALTFVMVELDLVQKPWPADNSAPSNVEPMHSPLTARENAEES